MFLPIQLFRIFVGFVCIGIQSTLYDKTTCINNIKAYLSFKINLLFVSFYFMWASIISAEKSTISLILASLMVMHLSFSFFFCCFEYLFFVLDFSRPVMMSLWFSFCFIFGLCVFFFNPLISDPFFLYCIPGTPITCKLDVFSKFHGSLNFFSLFLFYILNLDYII